MHNVLIVDDLNSSQNFMEFAIFRGSDRFNLVGKLKDADDLQLFLSQTKEKIDLILLDIHTNGKENGLNTAKKVRHSYPNIKIIILTFSLQQNHIETAKKIGCEGFWYKDYSEGDLLFLMDKIIAGEKIYPQNTPVITIGRAKSTDFTKQELRVLKCKVNGFSNVEICEELGIKPPTLDTHIRNLKYKTGYENMLQLVSDVSSKQFIIADSSFDFDE